MAIDTAEKRASTIAINLYSMGPSVTPNSSKDQEWREQAGYGYSGIAATDVIAVTFIPRIIVVG